MKQKKLLNLGMMLAAGLTANAQTPVMHEGFDATQNKGAEDKGYYEFINQITNENGTDEYAVQSDESAVGGGSLGMMNVGADGTDDAQHNNWWMRAVKFRNLPLEEGKSYRLSFRLKGSNQWNNNGADDKCKMNVALMQGGENCDIPLLDAKGNEFKYEVSNFDENEYKKYTKMFYFASAQLQKDTYAEKNPDKDPLQDKFFATFNVYNPGQFFLDEVDLVESGIAGVAFQGTVIRVDFGYGTNVRDLVAASDLNGILVMPDGTATVKVDDKDIPVSCTELREDGYMYIFLDEESIEDGIPADAKVEVAFTNPTDAEYQVQYAGDLAPEGAVKDFVDESGTLNENDGIGDKLSHLYKEPEFTASNPIDNSFNLPENISEVTFTFDINVLGTNADTNEPLVATLESGEELELVTEVPDEGTKSLTFRLKDGKTFAKGMYTVTLNGVQSTMGIPVTDNISTTFEIGKVAVAQTIYTPLGSCVFPDAAEGSIPEKWTVYSDGQERAGGTSYGSGGRTISTKAPQTGKGIYTRANGGEGSITSADIEIPAGDIELRSLLAYWSNPSNIKVEVLNSGNEVVATKDFTPSAAGEANRNTDGFKFDECAIQFNSTGGNYYVKYTLLTEGFNGMFVGGFNVFSYTMTEGAKLDTEVIAEGQFASAGDNCMPAHGTGWKIYRPDGRMRDPGANGNWGGDDWTGGGGPRVKTMGNKGMNGAAIYLAGGSYATYGEFDVQTDHGGPIVGDLPEKTLNLDAAKYNFTYYIIGWKNPGSEYTIQLDVYKKDEGINGSPVYTRKDAVTTAITNAADEAKKVQFYWKAPEAGQYILKFTAGGAGEGECCVGNVSIETTSSNAVAYTVAMQKNLEPAKAELELAMADEKYKGETRDALEKIVNDYANPDFTTVQQFEEAFANIETTVKKSETRRANIDKYPQALEDVKNGLAAAEGTKYEKLPQYPIVAEALNNYKDADCTAMSDEELQTAVDVMGNNGALLSNMVNKCVPLLTKQVVDLAAAIVEIDGEAATQETVLAADEAISDDQALAKQLKTLYAAKLYKKIAGGYNFKVYDETIEEEIDETIDASFLIQNPNFYNTTVIPAGKENATATVNDFPGWTIEVQKGSIQSLWSTSWGQKGATANEPVADCAVCAPWGDSEYTVNQVVENMPVVTYTASLVVAADAMNDSTVPELYAVVGEEKKQFEPNESGTYDRGSNKEQVFENAQTVVDGNFASLSIGAEMKAACFGKVDNAKLTITGKAANFDYAAAAAALEKEIETGISNAEAATEGEPVAVVYYDLNGAMTATPSGVVIKVATYANGITKVSKVVVK